jgi:hypothetical protein
MTLNAAALMVIPSASERTAVADITGRRRINRKASRAKGTVIRIWVTLRSVRPPVAEKKEGPAIFCRPLRTLLLPFAFCLYFPSFQLMIELNTMLNSPWFCHR